ncbi:MAG: hypothetical protein AMS24_03475 [Chlamydiae bacterium SM23_39]|nr:MAG: hypothetical protein AMS24_03475 [Chlamydiae bacterium SM23_39]
MKLIKTAIRRPITTLMVFIGICIFGFLSFFLLPFDLMPKIEPPIITIVTMWPGSSAIDVETKITKTIENSLGVVNNLKEISSKSRENVSIINCSFNFNSDLAEVSNEIRDKLELIKEKLPTDSKKPVIFKFDTSMLPIAIYGITSNLAFQNLYEIVDDNIALPIKRLDGIGAVQLIGGKKRQININLIKEKLIQYNVSIDEVEYALKENNISLPSGNIVIKDKEYMIRVVGEYKILDEIKNSVIKKIGETPIYLRDIANIKDGFKEEVRKVEIDDSFAVLLFIQKKSGYNTVDVIKNVKKEIDKVKYFLPKNIKISTLMDSSEFIDKAVKNLLKTILWAIFFVSIVTFIFLKNIRCSLLILISIPISVMAVFSFIYLMGWNLNTIVLSAIAISIGMVIDNSVVVMDSIFKNIGKDKTLKESAFLGAKQIGLAIFASTLTTIVIFFPLLFSKGVVGVMFKQLGGVITITLLFSLLSALMFLPMLASRFFKKDIKKNSFFKGMEDGYLSLLKSVLNNKKKSFLFILFFLILSFFLIPFIGSEFFPEEDSGDLSITVELPVGTPLAKTEKVCRRVKDVIFEVANKKYIKHSYWRCGDIDSTMGVSMDRKYGNNIGTIGAKLVKKEKRRESTKDIGRKVGDIIKRWPEVVKLEVDANNPLSRVVFGKTIPISIEILGYDLKKTEQIANKIKKIAKNVKGAKDVTISKEKGKPELVIKIDRERASYLGLDLFNISKTLRTFFYGKKVSSIKNRERDKEIFIKLKSDQRKSLEDIKNVEVENRNKCRIRLDNFMKIEEKEGTLEIKRKDQKRFINVDVDIYKRSQGEVLSDIKKKINKEVLIPRDVSIKFSGMIKEQKEAFKTLFLMLILGIVLVYMVMAGQFESLKDPFIIMFSLPFAFIGVIILLALTNTHLSVIALIGVLMLVGIAVNNAIVIVDSINKLKKDKKDLKEAIIEASVSRLRPVLITTITTICGMIPLLLGRKEGTEMWKPFAIAVIGGLSFSTFVTLILIPLLYSVFYKVRLKRGELWKKH